MNGVKRADYEKKIWGQTVCVAKHAGFTVHHLVVVPKSFCSRHLHEHRFNGFFVTRGQLIINEFLDGEVKETILREGDYYEVAPGVQHQFTCPEGTGAEALEIYFPPDVNNDDIVRFNVGGRL